MRIIATPRTKSSDMMRDEEPLPWSGKLPSVAATVAVMSISLPNRSQAHEPERLLLLGHNVWQHPQSVLRRQGSCSVAASGRLTYGNTSFEPFQRARSLAEEPSERRLGS